MIAIQDQPVVGPGLHRPPPHPRCTSAHAVAVHRAAPRPRSRPVCLKEQRAGLCGSRAKVPHVRAARNFGRGQGHARQSHQVRPARCGVGMCRDGVMSLAGDRAAPAPPLHPDADWHPRACPRAPAAGSMSAGPTGRPGQATPSVSQRLRHRARLLPFVAGSPPGHLHACRVPGEDPSPDYGSSSISGTGRRGAGGTGRP